MSQMINFAIDLGTTNSLIAKFNRGDVDVFKHPIGHKETLPSVVAFRKDRILIGDKARDYLEKDPKSTAGRFKRLMGTTETCRIESLGHSKTPVELSAYVLKELKTFIHTREVPEGVVITIPAAFDQVQCNATEEAGYAAGFKQVVLFQEPIAASLAYANKQKGVDLNNRQWIVYDLGGGTFDVALVRIVEGELKILDHDGDNYMGGADFDAWMVERLIVPQLEARGEFTSLLAEMKSATGRYNRLWYRLLHQAEEAKKELSASTETEIGISVEDDEGIEIDADIKITRSDFEAVIKDAVDKTAAMLREMLTRNALRPEDLAFVLMVGGSTYIPFVRKRISELLGIPVNTDVEPTGAIVIGGAYFAGLKQLDLGKHAEHAPRPTGGLTVKCSYPRTSREDEETFSAKVEGNVAGLLYRITRGDGAYDSGVKPLAARIFEDLPLQQDTYNCFELRIYDAHNNPLPIDLDPIEIATGFSPAGQITPHDLSLVLDRPDISDTQLGLLLQKGTVLPARAKRTVEVNRAVVHGSEDDVIRIIVVEGPSENHHTANRKQGELIITGSQLKRDVPGGTEVDLTFEWSESRRLAVSAYINPSGPEFKKVFTPEKRDVDIETLAGEASMLEKRLEQEVEEAAANEDYETAKQIKKLESPVRELCAATAIMEPDDVTQDKFKLDNRKLEIAQQLDRLTSGKRIDRLRAEYQAMKDQASAIVNESGNDLERRQLRELIAREDTFLHSTNPNKLENATGELRAVAFQVLRRKPDFLIAVFQNVIEKREALNDQLQARTLIEAGKRHMAAEDYEKLDEVIGRLHGLLPQDEGDPGDGPFSVRISQSW